MLGGGLTEESGATPRVRGLPGIRSPGEWPGGGRQAPASGLGLRAMAGTLKNHGSLAGSLGWCRSMGFLDQHVIPASFLSFSPGFQPGSRCV